MAGSRPQINKPHKTRFSSKASRQIHKTSRTDKSRISKSECSAIKGARAARIQRNKMVRDQKRAALLKEKRTSSASTSPPRVIQILSRNRTQKDQIFFYMWKEIRMSTVPGLDSKHAIQGDIELTSFQARRGLIEDLSVLFGLSASVNLDAIAQDLLALLSPEGTHVTSATVASPDYKLRATVLKAPHGDLITCMEMAKVADLIAFVTSASSLCEEDMSVFHLDSFGSQCLSVFKAIGLPSTAVLIRDLPLEPKRKQELKKMCLSSLASEFPEDCKFYPADTKDELQKFLWLFKEQRLIVPHWRSQRPFLMAQEVGLVNDDCNPGMCSLVLSGYVRARCLSVNQLVHLSGVGDFQLCKIDLLKDPSPLNAKKRPELMDSDELHDMQAVCSLVPDPLKQEPLLVENIPDPLAGEQTWPTEAEMGEADKIHKRKEQKKKILPRGTSDYQAAWILDATDEEVSGNEDDEDENMALDNEENYSSGPEGSNYSDLDEDHAVSLNMMYSDDETEVDSVINEGENLTREQIENEIRKIKDAHADDEEFPDEVDTPLDVPARKRFAKYRGLKSLRTSSWDPKESLPSEYARIFAFDNFARTRKLVLSKASDMDQGTRDDCVPVGSYIRLFIKEVQLDVASKLTLLAKTSPVLACGLFQHESKMSVMHFSIKKHDSYSDPIKAKESLIFHIGFRQFIARPIFSADSMNSNIHKLERFLHAGRFSVASVYAPISFPPLPLIVLKSGQGVAGPTAVAAVGSLKSIDPDRIILKKIVLTGYPQRVSKLKATVRYMFHNPDDVRWFKPVEVRTKCGRRGRIKEPVGTHGALKCTFDGIVQQHDTVCMSLYKRVFPKWPEQRFPVLDR